MGIKTDNHIQEIKSDPIIQESVRQSIKQKGYFLPIIIAVIVLIVLGIGGYLLYQKQSKPSQNLIPSTQSPSPTTSPIPSPPSTPITSCMEITSGGNYSLTQDITGNDICVNIHDASGVNIDCQNHTINSKFGEHIRAVNIQNFSIKNCNLVIKLSVSNPAGGDGILIEDSSMGIVENNVTSEAGIRNRRSNNLQFLNNTINSYSPFNQFKSSSNRILNNKFTAKAVVAEKQVALPAGFIGSGGADGVVVSDGGSNNTIENNVIDGSSDGVLHSEGNIGADDGILLAGGEKNIKITGNTIKNNWDCGIENIGPIENAQISKNKISNNGVCGIGGWYWNSWLRSTIDSNLIENTPTMFYFYRASGLLNEKDGLRERNVYFQDNTFSNNTFLRPKAVPGKYNASSFINFENLPPEIPASTVKLGNNVFKNNDFGKDIDSPFIAPSNMIIDQKDNKCLQDSDDLHPLECK